MKDGSKSSEGRTNGRGSPSSDSSKRNSNLVNSTLSPDKFTVSRLPSPTPNFESGPPPPPPPMSDLLDTILNGSSDLPAGWRGDGAVQDGDEEENKNNDTTTMREETTSTTTSKSKDGMCIECGDMPAILYCENCMDDYCDVCFTHQHRKGTRQKHKVKTFQEINETSTASALREGPAEVPATTTTLKANILRAFNRSTALPSNPGEEGMDIDPPLASSGTAVPLLDGNGQPLNLEEDESKEEEDAASFIARHSSSSRDTSTSLLERSKYIPLRLAYEERKFLRLLEATLSVCEYTDKIDVVASYSDSKNKRIVGQIREICSILSGLVLAADYKRGQELFKDRDFESNGVFFQDVFELGRRHKIMNPEKMRGTYGKLIYMLQDSQNPSVQDMLGFKLVKPIRTVYSVLEASGCLNMLKDELVAMATAEIGEEDRASGRGRREVQTDIKRKERALEILVKRYSTRGRGGLDEEVIRLCLYSIGDNNNFLRTNRDPCEKMISHLIKHFPSKKPDDQAFSLAIQSGREGARLSHGHEKQWNYVMQSLSLWREILHDMFKLWTLAEDDLLDQNNYYRLRDTGQGLNRVQAAPRVSRMMHTILNRAQQKVGYWVGSSVVHLGDHNVPNSFLFLDKYSQIYRILLPMTTVINKIDVLIATPELGRYIDDAFGSHELAKRSILCDFFRHGFDGSGADNFNEAGSCIDGRLTSAWNYCSLIEKNSLEHAIAHCKTCREAA